MWYEKWSKKAPGLDGFSMVFFQSCWDVLKEDLMKVFLEFFLVGKLEENLNTTFIALIPKKIEALEIKDYRAISLISGVHDHF